MTRSLTRYPLLATWAGIPSFKQRLCDIVGADHGTHGILAGRSLTMMQLAAHLLFRNCETVLTTDLAWPVYRNLLQRVAQQLGRRIVEVPLRTHILDGLSAGSLAAVFSHAYHDCGATGLFLPAISHDGVQLPVADIARSIQRTSEIRFFAVDGAQHLAHGETRLSDMGCDFYLAGTHKWMRSLYPLGVGLFGQRRSSEMITTTMRELTAIGMLDDPLMQFAEQLENRKLDSPMETVNLSALLSAYGATCDAFRAPHRRRSAQLQLENAEHVCSMASAAGWQLLRPPSELRSGIVMVRPPRTWPQRPHQLRQHLAARGIVATTYDHGFVRLSMPRRPLSSRHLEALQQSFAPPLIAR